MNAIGDNYDIYYADKLWNLLPAVYRAMDTDQFGAAGPLREMVNRIGAQGAVLRRSIDRMWEDQSIETCDDWLIPYIADLLATNLVANLDPAGQRLDVANTIYYRRRKGTVAILEEIAANITGWEAKVVECFRRMARTRHGLDPAIGMPVAPGDDIYQLQLAEGLVGQLTRTGIGGFADLRNAYGASRTGTAFDEYFHTADFRQGVGQVGWYDIPRVAVFLWRLKSYKTAPTTPVAVLNCPGWYTFDPTGRDIALFAQDSRAIDQAEAYGSAWTSPIEAQLPTPISQNLLDFNETNAAEQAIVQLYPSSIAVFPMSDPPSNQYAIPATSLTLRPARGSFRWSSSPPLGSPPPSISATYCYGFSSNVGAGPYDRRVGGTMQPTPAPWHSVAGGGSTLASLPATQGTVTISDSLTYAKVGNLSVDGALMIRADNLQRPLIRMPQGAGGGATWTITGAPGATLVLDGLFLSGGDVRLVGEFASVTLNCCTFDPGSTSPALTGIAVGSPPQSSSPGSPPSGDFAIAADGSLLLPTRLWIAATVNNLTVTRCILGPIRTIDGGLVESLSISDSIVQAIVGSGYGAPLSPPQVPTPDLALAFNDGVVNLTRCTILGAANVHQLEASECILDDVVLVDNAQDGCVRFSAWSSGSVIPRKYESVEVPARSPLFASTNFGDAAYGQLLPTADAAIIQPVPATGAPLNTITAGAQNGSEMGAFAREKNPIKERGLLIKYQEYLPAGLIPVPVYVT